MHHLGGDLGLKNRKARHYYSQAGLITVSSIKDLSLFHVAAGLTDEVVSPGEMGNLIFLGIQPFSESLLTLERHKYHM